MTDPALIRPVTQRRAGAETRSGAVLVGLALGIFGLFALFAVVLEVSAARMAQAELQDAVDLAAREGLRARDTGVDDPELARRTIARDLVALTFDSDLDLATEDTELELGAGGIVPLSDLEGIGGAGGFDPTQIARFRPALELNQDNEIFGDLVAGAFDSEQPALENADYTRADFDPALPGDAASATAFLVRARRTTDEVGLDSIGGVSSSGPPLPFLFGLGTTMQPVDDSGAVYDPRRDGLTVRATAIADAHPALAVTLGPDQTGLLRIGTSPITSKAEVIALDATAWNGVGTGGTFDLVSNGAQLVDTVTGQTVGAIVEVGPLVEVGEALPVATVGGAPDVGGATTSVGLVANAARPIVLVEAAGPGVVRVVAFGSLDIVSSAIDPAAGTVSLNARRSPSVMAAGLASVRAVRSWLALEEGGPLEIAGLRAAFDAVEDPLLVPVLSR